MNLERLKRACCQIEGSARGTGFLIGDALLATCAHVVEGLPRGAKVRVRFTANLDEPTAAILIAAAQESDAALLKLTGHPPVGEPLPLGAQDMLTDEVQGFGFPHIEPSGFAFSACVRDPSKALVLPSGHRLTGLHLDASCFGAGAGAPLQGISGAPIVTSEGVVAYVVQMPSRDENGVTRNELGAVYALPIGHIQDLARREDILLGGAPQRVAQPPLPGGGFRLDMYIPQAAEARIMENLERSAPSFLIGPSAMGKTWILQKVKTILLGRGYRVAFVNLSGLGLPENSPVADTLFRAIADRLAEDLCECAGSAPDVVKHWASHLEITATMRLERYFKQVLRSASTPLCLILDHLDHVGDDAVRTELLRLLRSIMHDMSEGARFHGFVFLVAAMTTLGFDPMDGSSPLLYEYIVRMEHGLNLVSLRELATRYGVSLAKEDLILLQEATQGNPYMCAMAILQIHRMHGDLSMLDWVDRLTGLGPYLHEHLHKPLERDAALRELIGRILINPMSAVSNTEEYRLLRTGFFKYTDKGIVPRYTLLTPAMRQACRIGAEHLQGSR